MRAILMFHGVDDSGSVLSLAAEELRSLVNSIRASGHQIVSLPTLLHSPSARRQVALTFDDGVQSVATAAAPVLRELEAPATLFVTTGWLGRDNGWPSQAADAPRLPMLSWSQVEDLHRQGWQIECHTVNHPDLRECAPAELEAELSRPIEEIERRLGRRPRYFAYPYGYLDPRVVDAAREHYEGAVTTSMATLGPGDDPLRRPRLDTFYLRSPRIHRRFGGRRYRAIVETRAALRRLKRHPGETG